MEESGPSRDPSWSAPARYTPTKDHPCPSPPMATRRLSEIRSTSATTLLLQHLPIRPTTAGLVPCGYGRGLVGVWTQGSKLVGVGAVGHPRQGESVAISGDGRTIIAGGSWDNDFVGAAWVFAAPGPPRRRPVRR